MDRCLLVRCTAQAALASLLMTRRASVQIRSTIEANPFERCGVKWRSASAAGSGANGGEQSSRLRQSGLARDRGQWRHRRGRAPPHFKGDSDAHIVRGLISILFAIYSDRCADEIVRIDAEGVFRCHLHAKVRTLQRDLNELFRVGSSVFSTSLHSRGQRSHWMRPSVSGKFLGPAGQLLTAKGIAVCRSSAPRKQSWRRPVANSSTASVGQTVDWCHRFLPASKSEP